MTELEELPETGTGDIPVGLPRRLVAEALGTGLLIVAVIGGAYFFTSSTSFANPAVTIARTLSDTFVGIEPSSAPMFILMQLLGGAIAFVLIRFLYPDPKAGG